MRPLSQESSSHPSQHITHPTGRKIRCPHSVHVTRPGGCDDNGRKALQKNGHTHQISQAPSYRHTVHFDGFGPNLRETLHLSQMGCYQDRPLNSPFLEGGAPTGCGKVKRVRVEHRPDANFLALHQGFAVAAELLDRLFAGPRYPFDEVVGALVADADVTRCWFPATGHGPAVNSSPSRLDRLGDIGVRTLVVHGTADPVFPVEHGIVLAEGIPGANLWLVEGLGHEVPDACAAELLPKVLAHLAG